MKQKDIVTDKDIMLNQINVLGVAHGFFQSSVLFALLKLKMFERIGEGSRTLQGLADEINAQPETLARLLNAGVVLKLLESKDGNNYKVSSVCRTVLLPSVGEHYLGNWLLNMDFFRDALSRLDEAVLKSGPTVDPASHLGADKESTRNFTLAMHNYASLRGKELAQFLDTSKCSTLLDLGCGPGTYAFNLGLKHSDLIIYLADLPGVLEVAKEIHGRYAIKNEVHYLPLDAIKEEIPGNYDMILVSNTLHMLGEKASRNLMKKLYKSINKGGSIVIQAQYMRDDRMGNQWPVFLDLIQLCITSAGSNHAPGETSQWLEDAGFINIEFNPMTLLNVNSFIRGYKP